MQVEQRTQEQLTAASRVETLLSAAQTQESDGKRAVARQLYVKCLALLDESSDEVFSLALTLARLHGLDGQHKEAISYYMQALDRFPSGVCETPRAAVTQALGRQMLRDGQSKSARRFFDLGLSELKLGEEGLRGELQFDAALCAWMMRDLEAAVEQLADLRNKKVSHDRLAIQRLAVEMRRTLADYESLEGELTTLSRLAHTIVISDNGTSSQERAEDSIREGSYRTAELLLVTQRPKEALKAAQIAAATLKEFATGKPQIDLALTVRNNCIMAGAWSLLGQGDKARQRLREDLELLNVNRQMSVEELRAKADVIHGLALSWVQEGNKNAALPLWRAVIETVNHVEEADASLADQTRHARALIISCIHASKNTHTHVVNIEDSGQEEQHDFVESDNDSQQPLTPEVRKLLEKRLNDLEYLDEAKKSLQSVLESPEMFDSVFQKRLEEPKISFESLWPGFIKRI